MSLLALTLSSAALTVVLRNSRFLSLPLRRRGSEARSSGDLGSVATSYQWWWIWSHVAHGRLCQLHPGEAHKSRGRNAARAQAGGAFYSCKEIKSSRPSPGFPSGSSESGWCPPASVRAILCTQSTCSNANLSERTLHTRPEITFYQPSPPSLGQSNWHKMNRHV